MKVTVLVFLVANQRFGIPAIATQEVVRAATLSPLPKAPPAVDGVLNLRGNLVPVLDLRQLLGMPNKELDHTNHFIIVQDNGNRIALRVDLAVDLRQLDVEEMDEAKHPFTGNVPAESVAMTDDGVVFVLDVKDLLKQDAAAIARALQAGSASEAAS